MIASIERYVKILLAYSDGRFRGLCPPRSFWFCTWCGRQSRPHQVQKRNVSGARGPRTPTWQVCQQYHVNTPLAFQRTGDRKGCCEGQPARKARRNALGALSEGTNSLTSRERMPTPPQP